MEFLTQDEFDRRFEAAIRRRAAELQGLGISRRHAFIQARREFSVYDLLLVDDEGRICFQGLDLPALEEAIDDGKQ